MPAVSFGSRLKAVSPWLFNDSACGSLIIKIHQKQRKSSAAAGLDWIGVSNMFVFDILRTVNGDVYSYNRRQQDALFLNFILIYNSTCFGQTYCPPSGVLILYSQQFVILDMLTVC